MYLGLDLGTSGLKGVVIDEAQNVVAQATAALSVDRPNTGWSEQDPTSWIRAAEEVLDALAPKTLAGIRAIGLSGQMHGATMLNSADEPLAPCILWNDTRSAAEAAEMDADQDWRAISGNIVFPGFTAPKLAWQRAQSPALFDQIAKVLLPKDYLRLWLTGEYASDMSDAAGTSWLDTGARDWSDALLEKTHLSREHMPRLVEGSQLSGNLRPALAARFGMGEVPVAGGGGDNAASAVGLGVTEPGQGFVSLGTSGVLFAATETYAPDAETAVHTFCHALPDMWHQMGVILACADALNWAANLVSTDAAGLTGALGPLEAPSNALFLPYLGGERTPLNSASIRGGWFGIDHGCDSTALARTVLEGITFALTDCRDALRATGTRIDRLLATGGGTGSEYWLAALATSLELPLELPENSDIGAAFGAARLGMMSATGDTGLATLPKIAKTIEPNQALVSSFRDAHSRYKAAANTLKELS
ncbi:MAG: xylulokinase [Rhodobacteraceae bacterium]|nr:xylulokinase [Paracoccaceae bacterium]